MIAFKINRATATAIGGKPARSPRRRVLLTGTFQSLAHDHPVDVRNLSCTGASVSCGANLRIGGEGVLKANGLDLLCTVIWRRGSVYGLKFDRPLPNPVVLELHRVTAGHVREAEAEAARDWFQQQAR